MPAVTIYIDNKPYEVNADTNALEACLSLGMDLPYFCWHPALGSVGACRQCAVKQFRDDKDTKGKLVMSCLTPIAKDMRISVEDDEARAFRAAVIEGLMESHPHDCPVCDEGGECHLQDMTVMTGHDYRRYRFPKRTFRNQYLGPFVNQEMNRCIQCYRCVRFYRDYANGNDFDNFGIRNIVFFGRAKDGVLENEFSGNLVEVCPTGVFTDKTLKQHYTRKWDLQFAPSICPHCSLGCNTSPGERYGMLRRIVNRYNGEVNGYFLCDRGRFGYEFVNSPKRVRAPQIRQNGISRRVARVEALETVATLLLRSGTRAIGIGSPRASLEANFVLRELVGRDRFFAGVADTEWRLVNRVLDLLRHSPAPTASLHHIERSDAALVLGEDLTNTAPRMALSLRQAVRRQPFEQIAAKLKLPEWNDHAVRTALQNARGPLFVATPGPTKLDNIATETCRAAPDDIARLGFAIAHAIDSQSPDALRLSRERSSQAARIATALKNAHDPVIIAGISSQNEAILEAAANIARALSAVGKSAALSFALHECNSLGLAMLGARPLSEALESAVGSDVGAAVIIENDLYRRALPRRIDEFFSYVRRVVVVDSLAHRTSDKAEIVFPAGTFAESDGTYISNEGRAQRFFEVFVPTEDDIQPSWRWLRDITIATGRSEARVWGKLDDVLDTISRMHPELAPVRDAAPPSGFRDAGQKIPREPHRYSGRTAMLANITVHEPKPPDDPDSALSFSMEGYSAPAQPPPPLIPFFWTPGWNSIQAVNKFQTEVAGPLRGGDPGKRLIEPASLKSSDYFGAVPPAFEIRSSEWVFLPAQHIFGSEELSRHAPGIAELSPKPYVGIGPEGASRLRMNEGDQAEVKLNAATYKLPVRVIAGLADGIAMLPAGARFLEGEEFPARGTIHSTNHTTT
ncbi:MAG TPA: NADH-quinone oxidoreductase subunit NuoG [Candidatus Acidoferrales bacterium]|nr:NADH-quinone oxidoreductase subunit NuoG [Candidatus Acidoferrales bacterium]